MCVARASAHALPFLHADAGGAKGDVGAGVAVAGAGGAGVEVLEGAVADEGAEVVEAGGGGGRVGAGAWGEESGGVRQVAFGVVDALEDEVGDAARGSRGGDFAGLRAGARLVGARDGTGPVGGAVDAQLRVPEEGVDDVVPEVLKVVDSPGGIEDPTVGGLVAELEREILPLANGIFNVELGVVDVEIDKVAVLWERCDASVEDLRHFDVGIEIDIVVGLATAATACKLHGPNLRPSAGHDGAGAALIMHQFYKSGA